MNKAKSLNKFLERRVYIVVISGIILGFFYPDFFISLKPIVPWVFTLFTLNMAIGTSFEDIKRVFSAPLPLALILLSVHGISPLIAYSLGRFSFGLDSPFFAGLILAAAIPVGISSTLWVGLAGGQVPLALSIISIDSVLSPVIVPLMVSVFLKASVAFDVFSLITGLLQMVVIPTIIGVFLHELKKEEIEKADRWWMGFIGKLILGFLIAVNIASASAQGANFSFQAATVFFVVLAFILCNQGLGYLVAKLMRYPAGLIRTFIFIVGLRNSGVGIVIALNYFPPEVAFPLIVTLMLQQPTAGITLPLVKRKLGDQGPQELEGIDKTEENSY